MARSKVTTKRGDAGTTVTIAGDRLPKSHAVLECCGQLDMLRTQTALCRLRILESGRPDAETLGDTLFWILHVYFLMGSECNDPSAKHPEYRKVEVAPRHLETLEKHQDALERGVTIPNEFILSASTVLAAHADIACTQARAFERTIVRLKEAVPEFKAEHILAFVNRLSDYFFVLARHLDGEKRTTVDYSRVDDGG